jgi:hypothetical protein
LQILHKNLTGESGAREMLAQAVMDIVAKPPLLAFADMQQFALARSRAAIAVSLAARSSARASRSVENFFSAATSSAAMMKTAKRLARFQTGIQTLE